MTENSLLATESAPETESVDVSSDTTPENVEVSTEENNADDSLIFGKYKDMDAATDAFKTLESENGRLRREKRLEAPEEYVYDFTEDEDLKDVVSDYDFAADPYLSELDAVFKKHNIPQEAVNDLVKTHMMVDLANQVDAGDEMQKLGPQGADIVKEVSSFVNRNFNEAEQEVLNSFATTAENVQILHKLTKMMKPQSIPAGDKVTSSALKSSKELYAEAFAFKNNTKNFKYNTDAIAQYETIMNKAIEAEQRES